MQVRKQKDQSVTTVKSGDSYLQMPYECRFRFSYNSELDSLMRKLIGGRLTDIVIGFSNADNQVNQFILDMRKSLSQLEKYISKKDATHEVKMTYSDFDEKNLASFYFVDKITGKKDGPEVSCLSYFEGSSEFSVCFDEYKQDELIGTSKTYQYDPIKMNVEKVRKLLKGNLISAANKETPKEKKQKKSTYNRVDYTSDIYY